MSCRECPDEGYSRSKKFSPREAIEGSPSSPSSSPAPRRLLPSTPTPTPRRLFPSTPRRLSPFFPYSQETLSLSPTPGRLSSFFSYPRKTLSRCLHKSPLPPYTPVEVRGTSALFLRAHYIGTPSCPVTIRPFQHFLTAQLH